VVVASRSARSAGVGRPRLKRATAGLQEQSSGSPQRAVNPRLVPVVNIISEREGNMGKRTRVLVLAAVVVTAALLSQPGAERTASARSSKIRRTILLNFKSEATTADIQKVLQEVRQSISGLQGVHNLFVGTQIIDRTPFRYGISMDFDDETALKGYRENEEHRRTHNDYSHLVESAQITDIRDE
jgi:hypothetical protein